MRWLLLTLCVLLLGGCQGFIPDEAPVVIQQAQAPQPLPGTPSPTPEPSPLPTDTPTLPPGLITPSATITLSPTVTNTPFPTATPSPTRRPTNTLSPTDTPTTTPTTDPNATPSLTSDAPTATSPAATATDVSVNAGNVGFTNGAFDQGFRFVNSTPELQVANGWQPFWDAAQKRPEYKGLVPDTAQGFNQPNDFGGLGDRTAQKWFCQFDTCDAGIQQRVPIPTGYQCQVTAQVSGISSQSDYTRSDLFDDREPGTQAFQDALDGSRWFISVNGQRTWAPENAYYGNNKGLPEIVTFSADFTSPGGEVTIGIGNVRKYGEQFQDSFIYDARLTCTN
jgi:hypothetical protein